jgi:hypothetical protein
MVIVIYKERRHTYCRYVECHYAESRGVIGTSYPFKKLTLQPSGHALQFFLANVIFVIRL